MPGAVPLVFLLEASRYLRRNHKDKVPCLEPHSLLSEVFHFLKNNEVIRIDNLLY